MQVMTVQTTQSCIMSSGILAASKYRCGHPKLLQLETALLVTAVTQCNRVRR